MDILTVDAFKKMGIPKTTIYQNTLIRIPGDLISSKGINKPPPHTCDNVDDCYHNGNF